MSRWPSPNFGERRGGAVPSLIVLHYTAMESGAASRARLCDPAAEVSAHWLIDRDGSAEALVDEAMRAWHAGAGMWRGESDVNSRSIGIELQNTGSEPFPEPQMAALESLLRAIMRRWSIGPEGVIAHSDMAPERKLDPGPRFDWRRLARQGLAIFPEAPAHEVETGRFFRNLHAFGYPEAPEEALLRAFRLRFRPWGTGPLAPEDEALAAALVASDTVAPSV